MLLEYTLRRSPDERESGRSSSSARPTERGARLEARRSRSLFFSRQSAAAADARFPVPCGSSVKIYYDDPPLTLDHAASERDMEDVLTHLRPAADGRTELEAFAKLCPRP